MGPCPWEAEEGVSESGRLWGWAQRKHSSAVNGSSLPRRVCELDASGQSASQVMGTGHSVDLSPPPPPRMLRNNRISCIHNDSFTGLRNVRLLSLYDNQITTISPGAFDTLQALSTL